MIQNLTRTVLNRLTGMRTRREIETPYGPSRELTAQYFFDHVLPPLRHGLDPARVVTTLKSSRQSLFARVITKQARWRGFPKDPAQCGDTLYHTFKHLESLSLRHHAFPSFVRFARIVCALPALTTLELIELQWLADTSGPLPSHVCPPTRLVHVSSSTMVVLSSERSRFSVRAVHCDLAWLLTSPRIESMTARVRRPHASTRPTPALADGSIVIKSISRIMELQWEMSVLMDAMTLDVIDLCRAGDDTRKSPLPSLLQRQTSV